MSKHAVAQPRPTARTEKPNQLAFQGDDKKDKPLHDTSFKGTMLETTRAVHSLFDRPSKNMLWSMGYGLGGLLLIPIMPVAVGAFCMAGVHLVSASYQFLNDKPEDTAENTEASSEKKTSKPLSLEA